MAVSGIPLRLAQVSDIHFGGSLSLAEEQMEAVAERINSIEADLIVIAGDLTMEGYEWEFEVAARWLEKLERPKVFVPGNHDARNVGYVYFRRLFGDGHFRHREELEPLRAERLRAPGYTIVGVDSSEPDISDGRVGYERYPWIREQFDQPDDIRIFVVHHHLVPIPGTGRERNIVADAGDLLALLVEQDIDLVLSGHKHVPCFWGLNGILIANSGTSGSRRVRGVSPPSWNEIVIDASTIKVFIHYLDGRRDLAVIFSRKTRALTREAFYLTDAFRERNMILAV